jgi:hypothetical protein
MLRRNYQNIEGVPAQTQPFLSVPPVHHPVDTSDTGLGPRPNTTSEATRHGRGINSWSLAPAALRQRLSNARDTLKSAHQVRFNHLWSQAPPDFVDIRLLRTIEISAVELMTVSY